MPVRVIGMIGVAPPANGATVHIIKGGISPAYLKPGFAFGGSCLPKDLRALVYRAARLDLKLPLLEAVLPSNERHLDRAFQALMDSIIFKLVKSGAPA